MYEWEPDPMAFAEAFYRAANNLEYRVPALEAVKKELQYDIRERFETETAPDGTPWPRWSPNYEPYASKVNLGGILYQTGQLYNWATSDESLQVTTDSVFVATTTMPDRGIWHDQGLPDRKPPLPQREFMGMSPTAEITIAGIFAEWFDEAIDVYVTPDGRIGSKTDLPTSEITPTKPRGWKKFFTFSNSNRIG